MYMFACNFVKSFPFFSKCQHIKAVVSTRRHGWFSLIVQWVYVVAPVLKHRETGKRGKKYEQRWEEGERGTM